MKAEAFTTDGKLDINALMALVDFINNGDPKLAPRLGKAQRLNLLSKLINKCLKFTKPKLNLFDLAKKLIKDTTDTSSKLNSLESQYLENPITRKNFIQALLAAAAKASLPDADKKNIFRFGINGFRDLQKVFSSIKTLAHAV